MRLLVTIDLSDADMAAFERYERQALGLLGVHGGEVEARLRSIDGRSETHLLHFPDSATFEMFLADPARQALRAEWEVCGARAAMIEVEKIPA